MKRALHISTEARGEPGAEGARLSSRGILWVGAALLELLALVGGMLWLVSTPGAGGGARVALVAIAAVLGGGTLAVVAAAMRAKE